jgi:hypothetical protein
MREAYDLDLGDHRPDTVAAEDLAGRSLEYLVGIIDELIARGLSEGYHAILRNGLHWGYVRIFRTGYTSRDWEIRTGDPNLAEE